MNKIISPMTTGIDAYIVHLGNRAAPQRHIRRTK